MQINLINGEGAEHDVVVDQYGSRSDRVVVKGGSSTFCFTADRVGQFAYYCSVPGHRDAGMEGRLLVQPGARAAKAANAADVTRDPIDLPPPIAARPPQVVRVSLETTEAKGQLDDGTTYTYWTFNNTVPGPMVRVRVGDTVEVHLKNSAGSVMTHSVDFHGATGPGGGAEFTQTEPGEEKIVTFKALIPGAFCARGPAKSAHFLWRPELHVVIPCDRGDFRSRISICQPDIAADHRRTDGYGTTRRRDGGRIQAGSPRKIRARRSCPIAGGAGPRGFPDC